MFGDKINSMWFEAFKVTKRNEVLLAYKMVSTSMHCCTDGLTIMLNLTRNLLFLLDQPASSIVKVILVYHYTTAILPDNLPRYRISSSRLPR